VHVASRIGAAALPGEILVSAATLDGLGTSYRTREQRSETLKGVAEPVAVVSLEWR
jgi:class 3 adenylate cyclase